MSTFKNCLKCGHDTPYSDNPPLVCAHCGAIFHKVEEVIKSGESVRPIAANQPKVDSQLSDAKQASHMPIRIRTNEPFIDRLRAESNYPAFRKVVNMFNWFGMMLAGIIFLSGLFSSFYLHQGSGSILAGTGLAIFIYIVFRVGKEVSLMVADMSDATVRIARRDEE